MDILDFFDPFGIDFGALRDFEKSVMLSRQKFFLSGKTKPFRADGRFSKDQKWLKSKKKSKRKGHK